MEGHENHNPEDAIQLFAFLSQKSNPAILYEAFHHDSVRFGQLKIGIKGIKTRTLSLRLTEKAKDLGDVFMGLVLWSMKCPSDRQKKNTKKMRRYIYE